MAQIQQRLNTQYAQSAQNTDGVLFVADDPQKSAAGTKVGATITYADNKLLPIKVGNKIHQIKTVKITKIFDGLKIPTTVEYRIKLL